MATPDGVAKGRGMFHVKHSPKKSQLMLDFSKILARGRQCGSEVSTLNALCAIMSAKAKNVKSFLRVCAK